MKLTDFENYIEDKILKRGLDYYNNGCIEALDFDGEQWVAEVCGTDYYTVTVSLSDSGTITDTYCDCPYDYGTYCKHQAAVFFALRENPEKPEQPKDGLKAILNRLDKAVLVSLLLEYSRDSRQIRNNLLLRFADDDNLKARAKALIKGSAEGARMALALVEDSDSEKGAQLCIFVLQEMIEFIDYSDDYRDNIDDIIEDAIYSLRCIAEESAADSVQAECLFDKISSHAGEAVYDKRDYWRKRLYDACIPLCGWKKLRDRLEPLLTDDMQKFKLISRFDSESAAAEYIKSHLDDRRFRQIAIENALSANELDRALELCADNEWHETLYKIYEKQGNKPAMRELAEELSAGGDYEYFLKLKKLYPPEEWGPVLSRVLSVLKAGRYAFSSYIEILIHEDMKPEIMEYCRSSPHSIGRLAAFVLPDYRDEAQAMYSQLIRDEAENASSRPQYQGLCGAIRMYAALFGKPAAKAMQSEMLQKYPRRTALADELSRLEL